MAGEQPTPKMWQMRADYLNRHENQLVQSVARRLHEANCRNEPEWTGISVSHRHVHTIEAMRQRAKTAKEQEG